MVLTSCNEVQATVLFVFLLRAKKEKEREREKNREEEVESLKEEHGTEYKCMHLK